MSTIFAFKKSIKSLELVGKSKEEFDSYVRNNFDAMEWTSLEIEEAISLGDAGEDHPIAKAIFDNGNEWVMCYPDADTILYSQKQLDSANSLRIEIEDDVLYFKLENELNEQEKALVAN